MNKFTGVETLVEMKHLQTSKWLDCLRLFQSYLNLSRVQTLLWVKTNVRETLPCLSKPQIQTQLLALYASHSFVITCELLRLYTLIALLCLFPIKQFFEVF